MAKAKAAAAAADELVTSEVAPPAAESIGAELPVDVSHAVAESMAPILKEYRDSLANPSVPTAYSDAELIRMMKETEAKIREGDSLGTVRGELNSLGQIILNVRVQTPRGDTWLVVNCSEGGARVTSSVATSPIVLEPLTAAG